MKYYCIVMLQKNFRDWRLMSSSIWLAAICKDWNVHLSQFAVGQGMGMKT